MPVPTVQVLTVSGTYTPPLSCVYIKVQIVGGGGGGASGAAAIQGSGGGAGQRIEAFFVSGSYSYTIGAGGNGGSGGFGGAGGGDTTFNGKTALGAPGGEIIGATLTAAVSPSTQPADTVRQGTTAGGCAGTSLFSQNGGAAYFGTPGRGTYSAVTAFAGESATGFGAGGGGGVKVGAAGGAGSPGVCIVTEFY